MLFVASISAHDEEEGLTTLRFVSKIREQAQGNAAQKASGIREDASPEEKKDCLKRQIKE